MRGRALEGNDEANKKKSDQKVDIIESKINAKR